MRFLHTMLRVRNLDAALDFYCNKLGLKEAWRREDEKGRFTLVFLAAPDDEPLVAAAKGRKAPLVELTYNWDTEDYGEARYFGHLAYEVENIYEHCEREGIAIYSGGQGEQVVGRGQIQYLASLFHPDTSNDSAPSGYNDPSVPDGLPDSPLEPQPSATGFRWGE